MKGRHVDELDDTEDEYPTKTVTVECTWKSTHRVEVPADFTDTGSLDDFPAAALEEMQANTAELTDWTVRG